MFWNWIRSQVKQAVLAGINDAAAELDGTEPQDTASALTTLRSRVLTLTVREEHGDEANGNGKKKARAATA